MLTNSTRAEIRNQIVRHESKVVNIVLQNEQQVAGEIDQLTHQGIQLSDGRSYGYDEIREINGLD